MSFHIVCTSFVMGELQETWIAQNIPSRIAANLMASAWNHEDEELDKAFAEMFGGKRSARSARVVEDGYVLQGEET